MKKFNILNPFISLGKSIGHSTVVGVGMSVGQRAVDLALDKEKREQALVAGTLKFQQFSNKVRGAFTREEEADEQE